MLLIWKAITEGFTELKHPIANHPLLIQERTKDEVLGFSLFYCFQVWHLGRERWGGGSRVIENKRRLNIFGKVQLNLGGFMNI